MTGEVTDNIAEPSAHVNHVGIEVRKLSHLIKRCAANSEAHKKAEKLTGVHGWIIGYLYENRGREIFQRDLEENFNIRRSSVSNVLSLMEQNGLIIRQPVERDARLKKVVLTQRAIDLHKMIDRDITELEAAIVEDIPKDDLEVFFKTVRKMINNLEKREGKVSNA